MDIGIWGKKSFTFDIETKTLKQWDRWLFQRRHSWREWGRDRVLEEETNALRKNNILSTI